METDGFAEPALRLSRRDYLAIVGHCYDGLPDEACGMLAGRLGAGTLLPDGRVEAVYTCRNADASARTYTVDSRDLIRALRDADSKGLELIGVFHSHTHTDAWPSPTDVRQAADRLPKRAPAWHVAPGVEQPLCCDDLPAKRGQFAWRGPFARRVGRTDDVLDR